MEPSAILSVVLSLHLYMTYDFWRQVYPGLGYPFPDMGAVRADRWSDDPLVLLTDTWVHRGFDGLLAHSALLTVLSGMLVRSLGWERILLIYLAGELAGTVAHITHLTGSVWLFGGGSGGVTALVVVAVVFAVFPRAATSVYEVARLRECLPPVLLAHALLLPGLSENGESSTTSRMGGLWIGCIAALGLIARARSSVPVSVPYWRWVLAVGATFLVMAVSILLPGVVWDYTHRSGVGAEEVVPVSFVAIFCFVRATAVRRDFDPSPEPTPWPLTVSALGLLGVHILLLWRVVAIAHPWRPV